MFKQRLFLSYLVVFCLLLTLSACDRPVPPVENYLHAVLKRRQYSGFNTETMKMTLRMRLDRRHSEWAKYPWLKNYYQRHGYEPYFVTHFLEHHQLDTLLAYLHRSKDHGLKPSFYHYTQLDSLYTRLQTDSLTPIETYLTLSRLELLTAASLGEYGHDLQFGRIDPARLYTVRFSIRFKHPDSSFYNTVFTSPELPSFLARLQPGAPDYNKMKDTLAWYRRQEGHWTGSHPLEYYTSLLKINMERLRWQPADTSSSYLLVNIPDYTLYAVENHKIAWSMKVCLGEKKESDYDNKYKNYQLTGNIDDRPLNHQTPLLNSQFNFIQLNPRWNVPASILQNELYYKLRRNPGYLAENNMKLFRGNKEVGRLDTIDWTRIPRNKIPFHVKQDAGEFNALGKLKFSFLNPYSIYLHDTPSKSAFRLKVRDVSHGCVRVSDPLKLAAYLSRYNGKNSIDMIRIGIGLQPADTTARFRELYEKKQQELILNHGKLNTSSVYLKKKTSLFIQYYTCWINESGKLNFSDDIYDLDGKIAQALQ